MMTNATPFKYQCQHCQEHLECPAEAAGLAVECPHCGQSTELPCRAQPPRSRAAAKMAVAASLLLVALIVAGTFWSKHHAAQTARLLQETQAAEQIAIEAEARTKDPLAQAGWKVSAIRLETTPGSAIIHANGTLTNETDRQRFGVRVKLGLFDTTEQRIGGANDYQPTLEPRGQWSFSALVVGARAVTAKVAAVEESP